MVKIAMPKPVPMAKSLRHEMKWWLELSISNKMTVEIWSKEPMTNAMILT